MLTGSFTQALKYKNILERPRCVWGGGGGGGGGGGKGGAWEKKKKKTGLGVHPRGAKRTLRVNRDSPVLCSECRLTR